MNVQGIGSSSFFGGVAQLPPAAGQASAASVDTDGDADGSGAAASGGLSRAAQFLSTIQTLQQSDPQLAKQMLTDLAAKFRTEASQSGGANSPKTNLANMLQKAADTGGLSSLLKAASNQSSSAPVTGAAAYSQIMAVTRASM